jgi:hypothetical protein
MWEEFMAYERAGNDAFKGQAIIGLCSYGIDTCLPRAAADVMHRQPSVLRSAKIVGVRSKLNATTVRPLPRWRLFEAIMKAKAHPEQGFRSCLGIHALLGFGPGRIPTRRRGSTRAAPGGRERPAYSEGCCGIFPRKEVAYFRCGRSSQLLRVTVIVCHEF